MENCLGVAAVTAPEGLEGIFDNAFLSCMGLEKMTHPTSVKIIGENAFLGCIGLEKFTVAAKNQTFTTVDGVLYSKDRSELLQCPGGKMGDVTIPAETSSMYENAWLSAWAWRISGWPTATGILPRWMGSCTQISDRAAPVPRR